MNWEKTGKWMSRTIVTLAASTPLLDAWQLMESSRFRTLPVIDSKGRYIGLLTYSEIFLQVQPEDNVQESWQFIVALTESTAGDYVVKDCPTIDINTPVMKAAKLMRELGVDALPVLDNNMLIGMLSLEDTFRMAVHQKRATDTLVD